MRKLVKFAVMVVLLVGLIGLSGIASLAAEKMEKVRIVISPYQDVLSVMIGIENGWFKEEGIELDIIHAEWGETAELVAGGSADLANATISDLIGKYEAVPDFVFTNLLYLWEGTALIVRPGEFKTYWDFLKEFKGDHEKAVKATCAQLRGKTINVKRITGDELQGVMACKKGGVDYETEVSNIDMNAPEGLAAFLGGPSGGDVFIGGLPQRYRALKEGMKVLITNRELGSEAVMPTGFYTTRKYAEEHMDTLLRFQKVLYRILNYIEDNPEEGWRIIVDHVNRLTAGKYTMEDIEGIWNDLESFPTTAAEGYLLTVPTWAPRNAMKRIKVVEEWYRKTGILKRPFDVESFYMWDDVVKKYLQKYHPQTWKRLGGLGS